MIRRSKETLFIIFTILHSIFFCERSTTIPCLRYDDLCSILAGMACATGKDRAYMFGGVQVKLRFDPFLVIWKISYQWSIRTFLNWYSPRNFNGKSVVSVAARTEVPFLWYELWGGAICYCLISILGSGADPLGPCIRNSIPGLGPV